MADWKIECGVEAVFGDFVQCKECGCSIPDEVMARRHKAWHDKLAAAIRGL